MHRDLRYSIWLPSLNSAGKGDELNQIDNENEQRALLGLLNDLGTIVAHGLERDDPAALRRAIDSRL